MALAKKCDRCGVFYEHSSECSYNGFRFVRLGADNRILREVDCNDLCPLCLAELESWFKTGDAFESVEKHELVSSAYDALLHGYYDDAVGFLGQYLDDSEKGE